MFIGRERELRLLERHFSSHAFEFVGVYGRRRVGKTALLTEFTRPLRTGRCAAVEDDAGMNLRILSQAVFALQHPDADPELAPVYPDFRTAIEAAFAATTGERAVLVIDEFPYLVRSYPAFPSLLQSAIDAHRDNSRMFLVLCGSSLSFMKEQLIDRGSPLYGRRTAQLELRPFDFFESRSFFPDLGVEDAAIVYGMVGGVPLYLLQFDGSRSLCENIEAVFLDPSSILYEEPTNLLKQEISKAATYNAVISAVAGGASQHNEIASAAGLESAALDYVPRSGQRSMSWLPAKARRFSLASASGETRRRVPINFASLMRAPGLLVVGRRHRAGCSPGRASRLVVPSLPKSWETSSSSPLRRWPRWPDKKAARPSDVIRVVPRVLCRLLTTRGCPTMARCRGSSASRTSRRGGSSQRNSWSVPCVWLARSGASILFDNNNRANILVITG